MLRRCPRPGGCALWIGHACRCWPADVSLVVLGVVVVLVGLVVAMTRLQDDVVMVLGDPLSRLVMLLLGLEACILAWGPMYVRAWRRVVRRR